MEWKVDMSEIYALRRWYARNPGKVKVAIGRMLNHFAFGTRTKAIEQVDKQMIVRNKRFVSSRIQVTKANTHAPVSIQQSITGSVATERFSGWDEQEYGKKTARKRFATLAGRGGTPTKKVRQAARLKPGTPVLTMGNAGFVPTGGTSNYGGFIAMLIRQKENRLVRIKGIILKRKRNKFEAVQILRREQPKKKRWLAPARARYFKETDLVALWKKTVQPLLGKPPRR